MENKFEDQIAEAIVLGLQQADEVEEYRIDSAEAFLRNRKVGKADLEREKMVFQIDHVVKQLYEERNWKELRLFLRLKSQILGLEPSKFRKENLIMPVREVEIPQNGNNPGQFDENWAALGIK